MGLSDRISKLEELTVKEHKGIQYDLSSLSVEELKYMLTLEDWETDTRATDIFKKIKMNKKAV